MTAIRGHSLAAEDAWLNLISAAWYTGAWSRSGSKLPQLSTVLQQMSRKVKPGKSKTGIVSGLRDYYEKF